MKKSISTPESRIEVRLSEKFLHSECDHCRHAQIISATTETKPPPTPAEEILSILASHKRQALSRKQLRFASGLTPKVVRETLAELLAQNKIAHNGMNPDSDAARFKLFGIHVW